MKFNTPEVIRDLNGRPVYLQGFVVTTNQYEEFFNSHGTEPTEENQKKVYVPPNGCCVS